MSIIAAMPCKGAVVVVSDSRATYGSDKQVSDECPKVLVNGSFGMGMTGCILTNGFSLHQAAVDFWTNEQYRLTKDAFLRFKDDMLALTQKAQPHGEGARKGFGNAWLVASAEGEPMIGAVNIDFIGPDNAPVVRLAELYQFGPSTPIRMEMIGVAVDCKAVALRTPHPPFRDPEGNLDITPGETAAFLIDVVTTLSEQHPLVGGAIGVTVLRPTPHASQMRRTLGGRS